MSSLFSPYVLLRGNPKAAAHVTVDVQCLYTDNYFRNLLRAIITNVENTVNCGTVIVLVLS